MSNLCVMLQEIAQFFDRLSELSSVRQIDNTEVIRNRPVKSAALHNQNLLLMQKIVCELYIIRNVEFADIQFREDVNAACGFLTEMPGISLSI